MDEKHLAKKLVGDKHMREEHVGVKRLWVMGDNRVGEKHVAKKWVRKVYGWKTSGDKHMREQHVWVKKLWVIGDNCVGERHMDETSNILVNNIYR